MPVQVHVQRGDDQVGMVVLDVREQSLHAPTVVIVDEGDGPHDLAVPALCAVLHELGPHHVGHGAGAAAVALCPGHGVQLSHQGGRHGETETPKHRKMVLPSCKMVAPTCMRRQPVRDRERERGTDPLRRQSTALSGPGAASRGSAGDSARTGTLPGRIGYTEGAGAGQMLAAVDDVPGEQGEAVAPRSTSTVAIVADSATDPPEELVRELGITLVPIYIRFGEQLYRDRVDISVAEVADRLARGELAKTINPGPADYLQAFRHALEQNPRASILCFTISARLSASYQSALVARNLVDAATIHVVDTTAGSLASGWQVIEAARAARLGESAQRILRRTESIARSLRFYALVDNLRHLYHAGRIGHAQAALGTLLDIKPILTLREGEVVLAERQRGQQRALQRLVALACEGIEGRAVKCAVFYTGAEAPAQTLATELSRRLHLEELLVAHAGPVITASVGAGLVGFALFPTALENHRREAPYG